MIKEYYSCAIVRHAFYAFIALYFHTNCTVCIWLYVLTSNIYLCHCIANPIFEQKWFKILGFFFSNDNYRDT